MTLPPFCPEPCKLSINEIIEPFDRQRAKELKNLRMNLLGYCDAKDSLKGGKRFPFKG
jgi:hypothetical protein